MKSQKGQSMVEFVMVIPVMLLIMYMIFGASILFHDLSQAANSAQAAAHAAAISFVDGSGKSCYSRSMAALGNPVFIMADSANFAISPCSTDPNWLPPTGQQVVATWTIVVNPPLPFLYSNGFFPMTVSLKFQDFFR